MTDTREEVSSTESWAEWELAPKVSKQTREKVGQAERYSDVPVHIFNFKETAAIARLLPGTTLNLQAASALLLSNCCMATVCCVGKVS